MSFLRRLGVQIVAVLVVPVLVCWYVVSRFFLLTAAQQAALARATPLCMLAIAVVAAIVTRVLLAPVARALEATGEEREALRSRAVAAALRFPVRLSAVLMLLACGLVAAVVALELGQGLPADIALAGAATGSAFGIMGAMLAYSVAVTALVPRIVELGAVEVRESGTVRGKVLVVGYGLLTIATLLLVPAAYVRYRIDTDREYLEAAAAAQERGVAGAVQRGSSELARLVFLATGAPSAVLASGGAVLASAPEGAALAPGAGRELGVTAVPGGWVVARAAGGLRVVSFVAEAPLRPQRREFWQHAAVLGAALFAACALLVWLAAKSLTVPIAFLGHAADRIAAGDLTVSPPSVSRDEMGQLAADFRKMAQGLAALVTDVQSASRGVHEGTREMGEIGERVKGGAREEHHRVVAVQAAVEAMQGSVQQVGRGVEGLADYVHTTSAAVGEMAAALEEVRRQAAELERQMDTAGRDVQNLSESGRRAQTQLGTLVQLAGNAQGTLASVSASLAGLETSAVASQLAAAQAAEMADHAGGVVQDAVGGIESLRSAVDDAKKRVTALGRRSDDIDKILDFIGEVAGRTNLLSLNASIIATQAGEHGKAFAVVADQIRELAAQISSSTKSIGQIIRAVRDDVNGTARLIERGDELAAEGVAHARKSLGALDEIRAATAKGHETAAAIREAVQAHATSTRDVSTLVTSVAGNSHMLSEAIQMVGTSVNAVGSLSEGVRALADRVSRALEEQTGLGRRQLESLELIDKMLTDITRAVENHDAATRRVREALSYLSRSAEQHEVAVVELSGVADRLGGRSRALAERVGRFKI